MIPKTYRKLVIKNLNSDFRSALEIVETELQQPQANEILIKNQFAGINGGFDTLLSQGKIPYFNPKLPIDMGVEVVGNVVAIGDNVKQFKIGDGVLTFTIGGAYREYQTVSVDGVIKVPEVSPEIVTLMPTGVSALVALEQVGEMTSQEVVLVTAAAGGTGHIAVQLAKLAGNHVIGTCGSAKKVELLQQLGCDRIINYRQENVNQVIKQEYPQGVNLVFECVGGKMFDTCVDNLAIKGRLVVVGFISEYSNNLEQINQPRIYHKLFWKAASVRAFLMPYYREYQAEAGDRLFNLFQTKQLKVAIDPTEFRGLDSIVEAVEYQLSGKNKGKVIVRL